MYVAAQSKPLYKLPETVPERAAQPADVPFLVGCDNGLYRILSNGTAVPLWVEGKVTQIVRTDIADANGFHSSRWFFVTFKGIMSSTDLVTFTECNTGLPFLTIKEFDGKEKSFSKQVPLLKDLSVDPLDQSIMVTATKDNVYLTRDSGATWKSIGSMSDGTAGIKAVAVAHMPVYSANGSLVGTELVVFMSHPIYGLSYYKVNASNPGWNDVTGGFENMSSITYPDELSDILPVIVKESDGSVYTEIYCSQTFLPAIYRFDWKTKRGVKLYRGTEPLDTIDGLCQCGNTIAFSTMGDIKMLSLGNNLIQELPKQYASWKAQLSLPGSPANCAYIPNSVNGLDTPFELSELWLLKPNMVLSPWGDKTINKKSIYVPANHVTTLSGIQKYKKIILDNKLNSLVIDMKDDYGLLRFDPSDDIVKQKGYVSKYKINLDEFVKEFKKDNIYLIARIVVFKDKNLANYDKCQYAVWNAKTKAPWVGTKGTEDIKDSSGNVTGKKVIYYDENWVDPYSEEVWQYNISIAKELVARGFDEIQFDYIRFPTDGLNMSQASFRWKDQGMDKESALISFLSYARKNINAPIGTDIYGANGWYRSGTRTGQDVELMSEYVDVISPMFYPSHFEQSFLNYSPYSERPYRIYFYGTYRNTVIGRNKIVVRPWVQAFYLGVSYDKTYYNPDYVKREVFGARDGTDRGYMYWNNMGRYDDIAPDPERSAVYPWSAPEAKPGFRKPAFSTANEDGGQEVPSATQETLSNNDMISIMDSVLYPEAENKKPNKTGLLLRVQSIWKGNND